MMLFLITLSYSRELLLLVTHVFLKSLQKAQLSQTALISSPLAPFVSAGGSSGVGVDPPSLPGNASGMGESSGLAATRSGASGLVATGCGLADIGSGNTSPAWTKRSNLLVQRKSGEPRERGGDERGGEARGARPRRRWREDGHRGEGDGGAAAAAEEPSSSREIGRAHV